MHLLVFLLLLNLHRQARTLLGCTGSSVPHHEACLHKMSVCISEEPEDSQRWMLKKQRGLEDGWEWG